MRVFFLVLLIGLSGCSWFHHKVPDPPDPPEFIVTGAPAGSLLFVDGVQTGQATLAGKPQVIQVAPGAHTLEVRVGDTVAYRETTYAGAGDKRVVTVLSGR